MSSQKTYDPFTMWQEFYKNAQNFWGPTMNEKVGSEEFSEWMGKVLEGNLLFKQMTDKNTKQFLDQLNLPSREDLSNLSALVINVEQKVDELEEHLEEKTDAVETLLQDMVSLKKEVKEIGGKLDDLLLLLQASPKAKSVKKETKSKKTDN